jgi:hypothetical protein
VATKCPIVGFFPCWTALSGGVARQQHSEPMPAVKREADEEWQ